MGYKEAQKITKKRRSHSFRMSKPDRSETPLHFYEFLCLFVANPSQRLDGYSGAPVVKLPSAGDNRAMDTTLLMLAQATQPPPMPPGTGTWLIWGIVLLAVAVALFFVEVFLPTGGVLGIVSGLCAVAGIVFLFRVDQTLGAISAGLSLLALPFLMVFALKLWPDTPFAKWITLHESQERMTGGGSMSATADGLGVKRRSGPAIAVGLEGQALTTLRPVGVCLLDGRREECMARSGAIAAGSKVRVVAIEGSEVWVKRV